MGQSFKQSCPNAEVKKTYMNEWEKDKLFKKDDCMYLVCIIPANLKFSFALILLTCIYLFTIFG